MQEMSPSRPQERGQGVYIRVPQARFFVNRELESARINGARSE